MFLDSLRVTPTGHAKLLKTTSAAGAILAASVAYLIFGISRYSFLAIGADPVAILRFVLTGLVGWGILTVGMQLAGRILGGDATWDIVAKLAAQAHYPITVTAVAIFALSYGLQAYTVTRIVAFVCIGVWFPVSVIAGIAHLASVTPRRAALPGLAVATVWGASTGLPILRLVGHLL